ncbi:MAG: hypothetical protein AAF127_15650 [Pseudomonadota bacterium]
MGTGKILLVGTAFMIANPASAQVSGYCWTCSAENKCAFVSGGGFASCLTQPDGCLVSGAGCSTRPAFFRDKKNPRFVLANLKPCPKRANDEVPNLPEKGGDLSQISETRN